MSRHVRRRGTCLVATVAFALAFAAGPASAQQSIEQNQVVTQGTTVKKIQLIALPAGRGKGERCRARTGERWGKNLIGRKVIRFFQTVKWCWNRKRITFSSRRTKAETPGFGWDFKGYQDSSKEKSRKRGRWVRYQKTAHFALCGVFCLQNKFYTIRQTVFRGGGYKFRSDG